MCVEPEEKDYIAQVCAEDDAERRPRNRRVTAEPVPPAGGEVEITLHACKSCGGKFGELKTSENALGKFHFVKCASCEASALGSSNAAKAIATWNECADDSSDRAHVTRLQAENAALQQRLNVADQRVDELQQLYNDTQTHLIASIKDAKSLEVERDALKAEVDRLRQHKNDYMEAAEETRKALQSELTKARELIAAQEKVIELAKIIDKQAFAKGTHNVGVIAFRAMGDALVELAHQSAPAAKDGSDE